MATVLVTGGSGTLGSHVVAHLRTRGHEARVLSRRAGTGDYVGDLTTGAGVEEACNGADWVVHAASDTRRLGRKDLEQTRHLLEAASGVGHLVYISIVGIDRIPYAYYRRKLQCEELISSSGVPHTILRATQFHELLAMALNAFRKLPVAPLPSGFVFQPVAAVEAALRLAELVEQPPAGRVDDFGGPDVLEVAGIARTWRAAKGRPSRFVRVPVPGKVGRAFREGHNTCPDHRDGRETWEQFLV